MKQNQFVRLHGQRWLAFETSCEEFEAQLLLSFPAEYRRICADLSLARTRNYSPALVDKLNALVRLGQKRLYQSEGLSFWSILRLFGQTFPAALYENRYYIWTALSLFWGLGLIAFIWVLNDPDAVYHFMEPGNVRNIESMYNPSGSVQTDARGADSNLLMFGVYIYNNIGIAFQMFAGGALFCIGALIPLLFNSFYFGAVTAHIVNVGFEGPFFSFVITHGSFELTAIIIAGAAGCKIGFKILSPGEYARSYAIKQAGKSVLPLIIGAFVMLVVAAFVEAFWSPLQIPVTYKYIAGTLCWTYVIFGLYKGTRYGT